MQPIIHHAVHNLQVAGIKLGGLPTLIRLIDCRDALIEDCTLYDPQGPADPHGQCVQLIRSTATIRRCRMVARTDRHGRFLSDAEDLLSVYGDEKGWMRGVKPVDEATGALVLVEDCRFEGRGPSDSGTAVCQDGPFPPLLCMRQVVVRGARVGFQHAGGAAILEDCDIRDCDEQTVATDGQWYAKARRMAGDAVRPGTLLLRRLRTDRPVYKGKMPGRIVTRQ